MKCVILFKETLGAENPKGNISVSATSFFPNYCYLCPTNIPRQELKLHYLRYSVFNKR